MHHQSFPNHIKVLFLGHHQLIWLRKLLPSLLNRIALYSRIICSMNVVPQMDPMTAVSEVLKNALHHEGLQRGIRLTVKALDRGVAQICFLAEDCDEANYKRLVEVRGSVFVIIARLSVLNVKFL